MHVFGLFDLVNIKVYVVLPLQYGRVLFHEVLDELCEQQDSLGVAGPDLHKLSE